MVTGWFAGMVVLILYTLAVLVWTVLMPLALDRWILGSGWWRKAAWVMAMAGFCYGSFYLVFVGAPSYFAAVTFIDGQYFLYGGCGALFVGMTILRWLMPEVDEAKPWEI